MQSHANLMRIAVSGAWIVQYKSSLFGRAAQQASQPYVLFEESTISATGLSRDPGTLPIFLGTWITTILAHDPGTHMYKYICEIYMP